MKISKESAANALSRAMDCLDAETQLRIYNALMRYLITGKEANAELDFEERGMFTLMINLVDCANANEE